MINGYQPDIVISTGVAGGAMFAVCDEGFAASLQKKLQTGNNKE